MSAGTETQRVLEGDITHDGSVHFKHHLTPSSQTDVVKLRMRLPDCIPIYPVRYGLVNAKPSRPLLDGLDASDYPALTNGKQWGLRVLRPRSFVYLLYNNKTNGDFVIQGFKVTEDTRFEPLSAKIIQAAEDPVDETENGDDQSIDPADSSDTTSDDKQDKINGLTLSETGTLPYIPAPGPETADAVQLLVCDTILTEHRCEKLKENQITLPAPWNKTFSQWRDTVATTVIPHGNAEQEDTFDARKLPASVAEMATSQPMREQTNAWSESEPGAPDGTRTAKAMSRIVPPTDDKPNLAVALHDPVGALSEVNNLLGRHMYELGAYSAMASRKLFASKAIDSLIEKSVESAETSGSTTYSVIGGLTGGASMLAVDRSQYKDAFGQATQSDRLSHVADDEAREQFVQGHPEHKQKFVDAVSNAGDNAWAVFQAIQPRYEATVALYDITTLAGFFDITRVAAQTLPALTQSQAGIQHLDQEMPATGPTGMTGWMLAGRPDVQNYIGAAASVAVAGTSKTSETTAQRLTSLLEKMPPRDESRMLSLMMAGLKSRGMKGPYLRLMQLWEGKLINTEHMMLDEMLEFVKEQHNAKGVGPFRPQHAKALDGARPATNAQRLYEMQSVKDAAVKADKAISDGLAKTERFWRNIHVHGSALVLLFSAWNAKKAFDALGREDGLTFANGLSAAGSTFATGAASAALGDAANQAAARAARHAGDEALADTRKAFAEKCATYMIGLGSAAAIVVAGQHALKAAQEQGEARHIEEAVAVIDGAAGFLGFYAVAYSLVPRSIAASLPELGLVPTGWILFAATALDAILSYWSEVAADNQAKNEWIARSIWGNGHDTDKAPFNDQGEAVQALLQLLAPPTIDTSTEWLHSVENTFIPKPWEKTNRSSTVSLPNWQPGESYYSITQQTLGYPALHFSNRPAEQEDGAKELKIELDHKIGKVQFESHYDGAIEVTYWPYGATDGDFSLTASNE